jgi:SARP family transcriptional regulator, regulator of embCAB operon
MDVRILGPLEVLDEGRVITLGGSKQRALLALLVLHANETLSTDRLIDELWGEHPPANAAKTVQMQISRLRRALAGAAGNQPARMLVTRERGYELRFDRERVDARRFERLVADGRTDLTEGRPRRAVSALEARLALWLTRRAARPARHGRCITTSLGALTSRAAFLRLAPGFAIAWTQRPPGIVRADPCASMR